MTTAEVIELMGLDPTRVLRDSINDRTITRASGSQRIVSFTTLTPAGKARVQLEVDA